MPQNPPLTLSLSKGERFFASVRGEPVEPRTAHLGLLAPHYTLDSERMIVLAEKGERVGNG